MKTLLVGVFGMIGSTAIGQTFTIGSGSTTTNSTTDSPYGTYYMDDRTQFLYTASEIIAAGGNAGSISAVAFNSATLPSLPMGSFKISIGTTSATSIAGGYAPATLEQVYGPVTNTVSSLGWTTYTFNTPFLWNGTDNLVIDVCFDNSSYLYYNGAVYADYNYGKVYSRYQDLSSGTICGTNGGYGGTGYYRAQTQFTILPPYADDAGIGAILSPSLPTCDLDSIDVQVVIQNAGQDTLNTCDVKWQIGNGTPTTYSFSGSVAPQGGTDTVVIATYSFTNFDELTVWTENPNGSQDSLSVNDTANMVVASGLSGTYNVPSDFATLTEAADALNVFGVCDDVVIEINSGTYNEQVALGDVLGVSEDATVTFTSATGNMNDVTIAYASTGSTDNYVVYLNGSDWVSFTDLTIRNNATYIYGTAVRIEGGAEHATFDNCHIRAAEYPYTGNQLSAVYASGLNHNLTLTNNIIEKGGYGLYLWGSSTTSQVEDVVIENNHLHDAYYYGVYTYYVKGYEFHNNVVDNDSNLYPYGPRAMMSYYTDEFNITGNYFGSDVTSGSYGGYGYPFYMYYCLGSANPKSMIANNCINAGAEGTTSYGYYGAYLGSCGNLDFHNNSVTRRGGNNGYYTFYINAGGAITVRNNSFADYNNGYGMYVNGVWSLNASDNNNFYTNGGTVVRFNNTNYSTVEEYAAGSGYDLNSISTDPAYVDTLACITCNDTLDNAGGTASVAMYDIDSNMRSTATPDIGAVEWVSPAAFTLGGDSTYCADEVTLEAGPAQSVTWSVNGNSSSAPTITLTGGSEATTYNVLVSIQTEFCGSASDNALITLVPNANLDSATHICADATATLNPGGLTSGTYTWSTGAATQTIVVDAPGVYTVTKDVLGCVSTASTALTQSEAVEIIGTEVCSDDLPLSLDATIANGTTYAWSGGAAPTNAVNTFNDAGAYTVTATDAFGCSSVDSFEVVVLEQPDAVISVVSNSGTIYIFDASSSTFLTSSSSVSWNFGAGASPATSTNVMETVTYPWSNPSNPASYSVSLEINNGCGVDITTQIVAPDPLSVEDLASGEFAIFPNPASDVVTIATKDMDAGSIFILDMSGRTVGQAPMNAGSNNHEINVSGLAAGAYIVKVATDANTQLKQLIVQ